MLKINSLSAARRTLDHLPDQRDVVRVHPVEHHGDRGSGRGVVPEYSVAFLGPDDVSARDGPAKTAGAAEPLRLRQRSLALSQCVGPLAILDIESHRVPLDHLPRLIAQRHAVYQVREVRPVATPQAHFSLERLTFRQANFPLGLARLEV